jgi:hypothetical protein
LGQFTPNEVAIVAAAREVTPEVAVELAPGAPEVLVALEAGDPELPALHQQPIADHLWRQVDPASARVGVEMLQT